jgi:4-amino-4-deoxy-L-arabinose transferase-like glycosyltransferase
MTSRQMRSSGRLAVGSPESVSPDMPMSTGQLTRDSRTTPRSGVWPRLAPSAPLLPILGAYILISVGIHTAMNDELPYLRYATALTHSFFAQTATSPDFLWHGPVLPLLLAPLVALHVPLALTRMLAGPVVLFATMLVFHRMARLYLPRRAALIATYAVACYLPFFTTIGHIHVEPLATLWFTLAAYFMVRSYRGGRRDHLWAGVALALLALSRVEYGYVLAAGLALSGIWLLTSRRSSAARHSTLAMAVALLLCTPWLAYTYSLTSKPFYWGDSGGLSLYWMSAPGNIGDWHTDHEAITIPQFAAEAVVIKKMNHLPVRGRDAYLQHVAIQNIKNHPKHYLTNVVANMGRLLFNAPYSYANQQANGTSPTWGMTIYAVPNAILIGLLAMAAFVAVKVRRRLGPEILAIAAFMVLAFAVHVPAAAYGRFLIPQIPVAAWLVIAVLSPNVRLAPNRPRVDEADVLVP